MILRNRLTLSHGSSVHCCNVVLFVKKSLMKKEKNKKQQQQNLFLIFKTLCSTMDDKENFNLIS